MKKKQICLLVALALVVSIPVVYASFILSYDMSLESLGPSLILKDEGVLILDIVGPSLYIGQSESVYFELHNPLLTDISISMVHSLPAGLVMADSNYGYELNGGGWLGVAPGDPLVIPASQFVTMGINILNVDAILGSYTGIIEVTILD